MKFYYLSSIAANPGRALASFNRAPAWRENLIMMEGELKSQDQSSVHSINLELILIVGIVPNKIMKLHTK